MIFFGPKLEPGRIFHYPYDFGPPSGVMNKFLIVADCSQVFYRLFVINTDRTELQKQNHELGRHVLPIDQASHPFLEYDSWVNCGELVVLRRRDGDQHIREKPNDKKCKISPALRDAILTVIEDSKLYGLDDRGVIKKSLSAV
jgi:hypothetical protein